MPPDRARPPIPDDQCLLTLQERAGAHGLLIMGALHPRETQVQGLSDGTLVLLGCGPAFWGHFSQSPEAQDGAADPVDRWSLRVVSELGNSVNAKPFFPFGGPPYAPFINWAQQSGRTFSSPVGMLVHDTVGLMISFRGALHIPGEIPLHETRPLHPCQTCSTRGCTFGCPVGALGEGQPYDVNMCHAHLATEAGRDCMENGCIARRACPLSAGAQRTPQQSALHMKAFHPE